MLKTLIVAATEQEIKPLLEALKAIEVKERLFIIDSDKIKCNVLITGAGLTATAFHLGRELTNSYNFVINAGIAGSFNPKIQVGETVNIIQECFGDLGAEDDDIFLTLSELNLREKNEFPFLGEWMKNRSRLPGKVLNDLKKVKGVSVNKVHGNEKSIRKIIDKFSPDVESMEGAACFYACLLLEIPFAEIRTVSNYVEKRNRNAWNIPLAVDNLNKTVMKIVEELTVSQSTFQKS